MADQFQSTIDNFNADQAGKLGAFNSQSKADLNTFNAGQQQQQQDFLGRYTNAVQAQPTTSMLASQIGDQLGLPGLQKTYQTATQTLQDLPRSELTFAQSGGGGGGYNANQLQQMTQQKLYDLAPIAQKATQQYQDAQGMLNTRLGYAQADQQKALLPFQMEQGLLSDRLAREQTGFQQEHQNELSGLLTQLQNGATMTNAQLQRVHDLSLAENNYQHQIQLQNNQFSNDKTMAGISYGNQDALQQSAYKNQLGAIGAQSNANINEYNAKFVPPTQIGPTPNRYGSQPTSSPSSRPPLSSFGN